jgi:hypothetical protein
MGKICTSWEEKRPAPKPYRYSLSKLDAIIVYSPLTGSKSYSSIELCRMSHSLLLARCPPLARNDASIGRLALCWSSVSLATALAPLRNTAARGRRSRPRAGSRRSRNGCQSSGSRRRGRNRRRGRSTTQVRHNHVQVSRVSEKLSHVPQHHTSKGSIALRR